MFFYIKMQPKIEMLVTGKKNQVNDYSVQKYIESDKQFSNLFTIKHLILEIISVERVEHPGVQLVINFAFDIKEDMRNRKL